VKTERIFGLVAAGFITLALVRALAHENVSTTDLSSAIRAVRREIEWKWQTSTLIPSADSYPRDDSRSQGIPERTERACSPEAPVPVRLGRALA
jgi:hypothetical protein